MQYLASETSRAWPPLTRIQVWRVTNIVIDLSLAFTAALAGQFYVEFIQPVFHFSSLATHFKCTHTTYAFIKKETKL